VTLSDYYAAVHAMLIGFALLPNPTGIELVKRVAEWVERDEATDTDRFVGAKFLRAIFECDGTPWTRDEFVWWFEADEGCTYRLGHELAALAEEAFDG